MLLGKIKKPLVAISTIALWLAVQWPVAAFELLTTEEIATYSREGYIERNIGDPQGPRIIVKQPKPSTNLKNPFNIEIEFLPQGQATIDFKTLIIQYHGLDVTQRIIKSGQAEINPKGIKVQGAEIRQGDYLFTILIADHQGRVGIAELTLGVL